MNLASFFHRVQNFTICLSTACYVVFNLSQMVNTDFKLIIPERYNVTKQVQICYKIRHRCVLDMACDNDIISLSNSI